VTLSSKISKAVERRLSAPCPWANADARSAHTKTTIAGGYFFAATPILCSGILLNLKLCKQVRLLSQSVIYTQIEA